MSVATRPGHLVNGSSHDLAGGHDDEHILSLGDERTDEVAALGREFGDFDAQPCASLHAVFGDGCALGETSFRHDEHFGVVAHDVHRQKRIITAEFHSHHTRRRTPHRPQGSVCAGEPQRHAFP